MSKVTTYLNIYGKRSRPLRISSILSYQQQTVRVLRLPVQHARQRQPQSVGSQGSLRHQRKWRPVCLKLVGQGQSCSLLCLGQKPWAAVEKEWYE